MEDEDNLQRFGTPLPAFEEDEVPSKKPVYVEDQIVTDENGKRRFHGAFTGGFSAGYWNTVGSQEGWTPQSFKSSRSEKAEQKKQQRPEDFMDDEDVGEFGIAPQRLKARADFALEGSSEDRKRKHMTPSMGPIPGAPVLQEFLKPRNDKVAVRILKSMGWRPGQGVGPRQTRKQKRHARDLNQREMYLMRQYCDEPPKAVADADMSSASGSSDESDDEITFAPDDYDPFVCKPKADRFGLGYAGFLQLETSSGSSEAKHINLFAPSLQVVDKNNKKLSIRGQAFGVGALEEEDEDIYARDDMTKYDFSLEERKSKKKAEKFVQDRMVIAGFVANTEPPVQLARFSVDMPAGFRPRNWLERRSRFAPLAPEKAKELETGFRKFGLGRHDLKPEQRGQLLGEPKTDDKPSTSTQAQAQLSAPREPAVNQSRENRTKELLERITAKSNNFTKGGLITAEGEEKPAECDSGLMDVVAQENQNLLAKAKEKTKHLPATSGDFKPFLNDDAKQLRYEKFIAENLSAEDEITRFLSTIQPVHLSEWDREMEKKEFMQARSIYKPLGGIMSDRFISETAVEAKKTVAETKPEEEKKVVMERTKCMWKPSPLLCKRYNIAEPFGGSMVEDKKPQKAKLSVFDYLETSINSKANFQTPVIIPKHIEKPKAIVNNFAAAVQPELVIDKIDSDAELKHEEAAPLKETTPKTVLPGKQVPKTELEKRVEENKDKPTWEKVELFKAIFDDSSDDETATNDDQSAKAAENAPTATAALNKPLSAAAANLLRNTSPPRGIFAALFAPPEKKTTTAPTDTNTAKATVEATKTLAAAPPPKIVFKSKNERLQENVEDTAPLPDDIYGPKVPERYAAKTVAKDISETDIDRKLFQLFQKSTNHKTKIEEEEWVEKTVGEESDSSSGDSSSSSDDNSKSKKKHKKSKKKSSKSRERKHKKKDKKKSKKRDKSHKSKKRKQK